MPFVILAAKQPCGVMLLASFDSPPPHLRLDAAPFGDALPQCTDNVPWVYEQRGIDAAAQPFFTD